MLLQPEGGGESPRKTRKVPKKADASQTSDSAKPRFGGPAPKPRTQPWTHGAPRTEPRPTPTRTWGAPPTTTGGPEDRTPSWWSPPLEDSGDLFMDLLGIQRGQKKQKALKDKVKTLKPRDREKPVSMPKAKPAREATRGGAIAMQTSDDSENFLEMLERRAREGMRSLNKRMPGPTIPDRFTTGRKLLGLDPSESESEPESEPKSSTPKVRKKSKKGTDSSDEFLSELSHRMGMKKYKAEQDEITTLKPRYRKKPVPMPKASSEAPRGMWSI